MIHIAYTDISAVDRRIYNALYSQADPQRQSRADRYLRFEDSVRCVSAGALLRYALMHSLGIDTFETGCDSYGKPHIIGAGNFHFNLSHAGNWVVIAYGDVPVGIDIEKIDAARSTDTIASRFYTPDEQNYICGSTERFFEIWTAKESYIKYLGKGLQMGLDSFSVFAVEGVCFSPVAIDPQYRLTLCADGFPHSIKQIALSQLIK